MYVGNIILMLTQEGLQHSCVLMSGWSNLTFIYTDALFGFLSGYQVPVLKLNVFKN